MSAPAILAHLRGGERVVLLHGCAGSYLALLLARLARSGAYPRPLVVVTPDEERARELVRDLGFFLGGSDEGHLRAEPALHLPAVETSPYAEISFDRTAMMRRMSALYRLSQGDAGEVLVTSAAALRRRVLPRPAFAALCDLLVVEEEAEREATIARLLACGFNRAPVVEDPGTFAVRGGILDIYPPLYRYPVRVELYGDLVESIRLFDPATQRTLRPIDELVLHPVRETVPTGPDGAAALRARVLAAADEAQHPSHRTRELLEELESGREVFGVEALTPAFHERLDPLSSYLPPTGLWAVVDPEAALDALQSEDRAAADGHRHRLASGRLTFPPSAFFTLAAELIAEAERHPRVEVRLEERAGAAVVRCATKDNADVAVELQRARAEREGELSLDLVRTMSDEDAERLLTRLPGLSWKAARCVLLYSLRRDVFPVDGNTFRILKRTGVLSRRAVYRRRTLHDAVQDAVPAHRRRALHVNLVVHGQRTCLPRAPQCPRCPLLTTCPKVGLPVGASEHVQVFLATPAKARAAVARGNARQ